MPSTKRYFTVLVFGLVLCVSGTLLASDGHDKNERGDQHVSFPGQLMMLNPCPNVDKNIFTVHGMNVLQYHEGSKNVSIHLRFFGKGMHGENPVKSFLHAKVHAAAGAESYDLPFESVWVEKGSPNFTLTGTVRIWLNPGSTPITAIQGDGLALQCTNDNDLNAPERKRDNEKDDDDRDDRN